MATGLKIGGGINMGGGITVVIPSTPVITINSQPSSSSVGSGSSATFSVSASVTQSASLSYQWQKAESFAPSTWGNIGGATSSSYTTGALTVSSDNGDKYRVVVSATGGATDVTSSSATVTVSAAVITILSQPSSTSASEGGTASFSVSASASLSASLSYQWAVQAGGTGGYSNVAGATSSSYTTGTLTSGDNNNNYRVVVSGTKEASPVTSNPAALTVSGGGSGTTYTYEVDYSSGINFSGSSSPFFLETNQSSWFNTAGYTALTALSSGNTFNVTMPTTGSTSYTVTLTSSWSGPPQGLTAFVTSSPTLPTPLNGTDGIPSSVTIGGGGGGGGSSSTGTITVGSNSGYYGAGGPTGGTLSISPAVAQILMFIGMATSTVVVFADGTYGGVVVDASGIDGATNVSVTLNSITQSGTVSREGPQWVLTLSGDPFFLQTFVGQTKSVEISWS